MMTNMGNSQEFLLSKLIPMDQKQYQQSYNIITQWINEESESSYTEEISWKIEREALINLTEFILENQEIIENELSLLRPVQHNITFKISDLLDTLNPPPIFMDNDKPERPSSSSSAISRISSLIDTKRDKKKIFRKRKH